ATALMLKSMEEKSFVVTTAYIKTEAIQAAIFGFVFLNDPLTPLRTVAVVVASFGVILTGFDPKRFREAGSTRPLLFGLGSAALFALSAVGVRGAILELSSSTVAIAAGVTLVI